MYCCMKEKIKWNGWNRKTLMTVPGDFVKLFFFKYNIVNIKIRTFFIVPLQQFF